MSERIVGRRVVRLATVGSTMDEAAAMARAGEAEGVVVVAEEQTAGRGRAGRIWHAPAGSGILASALLRPPVPPTRLPLLPLAAGVAVAEAVEAVSGLTCRLKWPNDVWIGEGKVAGLLVAARIADGALDHAVLGIGLNVNAASDDLPPGAASLRSLTGAHHDRERLLAVLLDRLDAAYRAYLEADGRPDLADYRRRLAFVGEPVVATVAGVPRHGVLRGVDDEGALLLTATDGGVERIVAGDLVRGPIQAGRGG